MSSSAAKPSGRVEAIDAFRGFTIFAMIFVIMVAGYKNLPFLFPQFGSVPLTTFKHAGEGGDPEEWRRWEESHPGTRWYIGNVKSINADGTYNIAVDINSTTQEFPKSVVWTGKVMKAADPKIEYAGDEVIGVEKNGQWTFQQSGIGVTFCDLVAPFFVFIVGLCIPLSRMARGDARWWKHVLMRTLGLILLGVLYISLILKVSWWWGILQAIGVAYFMGAVIMLLPMSGRWIVLAALAGFHAWMSLKFPWWLTLGEPGKEFWTIVAPLGDKLRPLTLHCTPWGSIGYGLTTIAGTFLGEAVATKDRKQIVSKSILYGVIFTAVGLVIHQWIPMHKDIVSSSYGLFTAGIACFFFLGFYMVIDILGWKKGWVWFLGVFGANALLAYFMQPVVRIFLQALGIYSGLGGQAGWGGMYKGVLWTLLLWCVVLVFNRKNIYWKL